MSYDLAESFARSSGRHPALFGQTWANSVKPLFKLDHLEKAHATPAIYCGVPVAMHNGWYLASAETGMRAGNSLIATSCPVKPGQTWSNLVKAKKRFDRQAKMRLRTLANCEETAERLLVQLELLIIKAGVLMPIGGANGEAQRELRPAAFGVPTWEAIKRRGRPNIYS
jgi:hypothetical protein